MTNLYSAVGVVAVTNLTETERVTNKCKFSHVVDAESSDDACDKVIGYYLEKSSDYESFSVDEIEIFDFIK